MEFSEKLRELRKQRNLTQEELAKALFVSRTAISKWESGRGYPSIDSLKAIAAYFSLSVDELLSSKELIHIAETDSLNKSNAMHDLVFGLLDCSTALLIFLPFFGRKTEGIVYQMSLLSLTGMQDYIKAAFWVAVSLTILWGIAMLALQNYRGKGWMKAKRIGSLAISAMDSVLFIITLQPNAAVFSFMHLLIKGILILKRQ